MAVVGLVESLLTARLVDDITGTGSDKTREAWALGAANIAAGCFGAMGGCAMIGQTMINVRHGRARTRLSTLAAAGSVLLLALVLADLLAAMPMAALTAVMVFIAVTTFDWRSVAPRTLKRSPWPVTVVLVATVGLTVATHDLAIGVTSARCWPGCCRAGPARRSSDLSGRASTEG
ncbi:hypothetical protein A5N15_08245 [Rothia kristinae]|uniref:SLC26A/SulP transporter domain-containing protein n=1 Tax=Rothia kristinae TaxID=37923 RepID=A0A657IU06_9MICC|nr:hypothetical protein A5N15_08245 [Rothia kristinae]